VSGALGTIRPPTTFDAFRSPQKPPPLDQSNFIVGPIRDDPGNSVFSGLADYAQVFPIKQYGPDPGHGGQRNRIGTAFNG
jgi:hypothetical protein